MRVATFNLENLDMPIAWRTTVLRPALQRLEADVLCLQEVNGQHVPGEAGRKLITLDELLAGTAYAVFHRTSTMAADGADVADVHNLVTLSRYPILHHHQVHHHFVPPVEMRLVTADPPASDITKIKFNRPMLVTELDPGSSKLTVVNVHLRAPLATAIPGQKISPFVRKSVGAWAEACPG